MDRADGLGRLVSAPTGHLATITPAGSPHLVVVTFAVANETIFTAVDHKPKTTPRLQRLVNIETSPAVSFLVDEYHEDWARLWWVRVDGRASVHLRGSIWDAGVQSLVEKYAQYGDRPPTGPMIAISIDHVTGWASTP